MESGNTITAQITIMNTGGISLASDSVVTIGRRKVYNSVDKLFGFSGNHTIGVMIYESSSMFDVPWETLIKTWKRNRANT